MAKASDVRLFIGDREVIPIEAGEITFTHHHTEPEVLPPEPPETINCRCSVLNVSDRFCNDLEFFGPTQMAALNQVVRHLFFFREAETTPSEER